MEAERRLHPQLAKVNPEQFGGGLHCRWPAFCTGDGCAFLRAVVLQSDHIRDRANVVGPERVHEHVGVEPSGGAFNALSLDERNHNIDLAARKTNQERACGRG